VYIHSPLFFPCLLVSRDAGQNYLAPFSDGVTRISSGTNCQQPCLFLVLYCSVRREKGMKQVRSIASHLTALEKKKKRHFTGVGLGFLNNEKESI